MSARDSNPILRRSWYPIFLALVTVVGRFQYEESAKLPAADRSAWGHAWGGFLLFSVPAAVLWVIALAVVLLAQRRKPRLGEIAKAAVLALLCGWLFVGLSR